jgi:nitroreductase
VSTASQTPTRSPGEALTEAATAAGFAPSIHNTQPWHWRVGPDFLELSAVPQRQLPVGDADGRMAAISCGASLHHARIALTALGYGHTVTRVSDPEHPELLARIVLGEWQPTPDEALRHFQTISVRRTDRRPVVDEPVSSDALARVVAVVEEQGEHLHVLHPDQVLELASAASYAQRTESAEEVLRTELGYWVSGQGAEGTGVPAANLPSEAPQTTVPGRDFYRTGTLNIGGGHDRAASYTLLYGERDDLAGWLVAGEALSALWLAATELGLCVLPLSAVVEVLTTRERLRGMLTADEHPHLIVRLGHADAQQPGPEPTPRLPATETVEILHEAGPRA